MKVDVVSLGTPLDRVAGEVQRAAERGHDGWFVGETRHDPFLACTAAGLTGARVQIGSAIAVAFSRSPMHVAYAAHDLQALTEGRFVLGLGSQVKAHVEKRFGATWSRPAARMREYVLALRAIWEAWDTGGRLAFRGEFHRHTLMTPFFAAEPHEHGPPPVWLAAVGPRMTAAAGEVADGLICHAFTTERYLREVTLPHLEGGARAAGRDRSSVEVSLPVFVVTGGDETERAAAAVAVRRQLAFYGSTPAYRGVLDLHGWGGLHERLHAASLRGRWEDMADMIDDEVLDTFAIVAQPDEVGQRVRERFTGAIERVSLSGQHRFDDATWQRVVGDLRGG